jgi:hypothetical protein
MGTDKSYRRDILLPSDSSKNCFLLTRGTKEAKADQYGRAGSMLALGLKGPHFNSGCNKYFV